MKTTSQDSKQNQSNNVDKADKAEKVVKKAQQPESVQAVEQAQANMLDQAPMAAGEQLDLELPVAELMAMVSEQEIDEKKRKEKKDNDDQDAEAKQQSESDQQQASEEDMSTASAGEVGAEDSEVNDIAKALSENSNEGSEGGLSIVTIALGAAGVFGAASYYKNYNSNNAPTFSSGSSAGNITENSGANQVIYNAVATDDIDAEVTYSLSGADAGSFSINSASGEVRFNLNPNHEVKSQYNFTVLATDLTGLASSQPVSLQITDIDDFAPTITSAATGSIDENSAANSVIYTATADDSADISAGVTFSLSGADADALTIDANTGAVTVNSAPDYEAKTAYSFSVVATDAAGNASAAKAVTIDVNNLDEIAPTITSGAAATSVNENIDAGQVIYTATATDIEDISGGVTFNLSGVDAAAFTIDENSGEVSLVASPDHEAKSAYSFDIIATDAAGNASASQTVTLNINNLDEVAPSVTSVAAADPIVENSAVDEVIYTATADDSNDISDGYTFSLAGADADSLTIDANSGEVTLNNAADHEAKSQYNFSIIATDAAGNASAPKVVSIDVTNLDESAPTITSTETGAINENIGANSIIYTATADDSADISDGVTFSLSGADADALSIDVNTGEVTVNSAPDYEAKTAYSFSVVATDAAGNASAAKAVTIDVNNLDEIAPTITSGATATSVNENIDAGQVIYTATATDIEDISGGVTFGLSGADAAAFTIDENSGEVSLVASPDHEAKSAYSFEVIATDAAGNASAPTAVALNIIDLDDAPPTITSGATADPIVENSAVDQVIYTATADDSNDISDGYTFSLAGADADALTIDANSGEVTLDKAADHEAKSQYNFSVIATDAAGNASESKAVVINVTDIDDAAPLITSDNTTAINENVAGQAIYNISYDDSGDDQQDPIAYGFLDNGGNAVDSLITDDLDLSISAAGEITLNNALDFEDKDTHSFIILVTNDQDFAAKDDLDYRLGSVKQITLSVNNVDDTAPEIISSDIANAIDENGADGQLVYTAIADDTNDVSNGVKYSLAGADADALSINENTGAVTLNSAADFEDKSQYTFDVIATDLAGNASSAKTVTLDINDIDEAPPVITSDAVATTLAENSGAGQLVYTAVANDASDVVYSLSGADADAFSIDAASGAVTLVADPDFEAQNSYAFNVIATDIYGNASLPKAVSLAITNTDDTAPTISLDATEVSVDENSGAGQVLFTATADDSEDVSDGVSYSLSGADADLFSVNATGEITLTGNPNYEEKSQYNLNVVAEDGAGGQSAVQALTLNITNLDEQAPVITTPATAKVLQGAGANALVYRATADDSGDTSGGVNFGLAGIDAAKFSIDPDTGEVLLIEDPSTVPVTTVYNFSVVATDAAGIEGSKAVTLSITDQDLDAPEITSADTATAIDENSGAGQVVYTVTSIDESVVTYSLTDDDAGAFSIDPNTGAVTLNEDPDAEAKSEYSFTVVATDAASNASAPKTVSLSINNLDEVAPTITSGDVASAIDENTAAGQVVYTATADDSADVSDTPISFSLSGADASAFSIDENSGEVTLLGSPDQELKGDYNFAVIATDAAGNSSDAKAVSLTVNDLDDSAPTITSGDIAPAIDSDSGANQVVYTATADDSADVSDGVSFSLAGADAAVFSIDAASGEVSLTSNPIFETKSAYDFEVVATDAAGNASASQAVTLKIDELAPPQAILSLSPENDTGIAGDNISSARVITVSNLKDTATWEYSIDNGVNWSAPLAPTVTEITLPNEADSTYQVQVRQTNASNDSADNQPLTSVSDMVEFTVDTSAPFVEVISASSAQQTITIAYNEALDPSSVPAKTDYEVTQSGNDLTVSEVKFDSENSNNLLLVIDSGLNNGAVRVVYTPSDNLVKDAAGNQSTAGFNSMIVSDGYIRGAEVYIDRNEDGVADAEELLPGYTTDEFGQLILPDSVLNAPENVGKQIIVQGGINMDTGALNEIELKAPVGYEVINPLSTLVSKVIETGVSLEEAEAKLAQVFDIKLGDSEELATYDPLSDISENALSNRVVVTQIATVLSVASAVNELTAESNDVEDIVLTNLANIVVDAQDSDDTVEIDADRVEEILSVKNAEDESELVEGVSTQILDRVQTAVEDMSKVLLDAEQAEDEGQDVVLDVEVEKVIKAQAIIIDDIAPKTPEISLTEESDLGVSNEDGLTSDSSPTVSISFDTKANDGLAVVVGDILQIFNNGITEDPYTLEQADIDAGFVELPLSNLETGSYFVSASIQDRAGNSSFVTSLKVTVDIDAPVFSSGAEAAAIDENTVADQVIYTPTSSSDDLWKFELIESSDSAIYFDQESGLVKLAASPDFELVDSYSFTLKATDNAGNASEQQVTLNINNLDEVAPIITSDTAVEIIENAGAGQVVYTATADDSADNSNGVTFSLAGDSASLFSIDASTGEVTLLGDPDFEAQSSYSFDVIATDAANNASAPTTVTLNILNADEQAPTITSGDSASSIDENSGAGQLVYTATASDDADISAGVTFSLAGADADLFSIEASSGAVTLIASPDYEAKSAYSFDVIATDGAGNESAPQTVSLSINNIDDTAPTVTSGDSATSIDENTSAGQVVYTATADDSADTSEGVTFSIAGADASLFSIDSASGEVTLISSPDYEAKSNYSFDVVATDAAGNESAPKSVTLSVNNVDDSAPTITSGDTATSLIENSGAGQQVYIATASDLGDISDGVTFSLAGVDAAAFSIDAASGAVTLLDNPDYEAKPAYSFDIIATDAASNQSAPKTVALTVGNVDDTPPTITSGETATSIAENSGAGQVVYTATADDSADIGGGVTFSLAGTDAALLSIDSATGVVTLIGNPDFESKAQYLFDVIATDAVGLASEPKSVSLAIANVIDSKPIWESTTEATSIDENSGAGQVVYTAQARVDLEGQSTEGEFISAYNLVDDSNGAFEIDSSSGEVTLKGNPDFELAQNYSFSVTATDSLDNVSEPIIVTLGIGNLDDTAPSITSGDSAGTVVEDSGAGQVVYTATAADDSSDIQAAGPLTYTLSGADAAAFSINAQSGEVSLIADPDFEGQNQYSFDVVAADAAGNSSSAKTVTLSVADLDDSAPVFTSSDTAATVVENSGANQLVYTAIATDNSVGDISYSINVNVGNVGNVGGALEADAPIVQPNTQHIYVSEAELSDDGSKLTVKISYLADEANLSGIGFSANFDSSVLSLNEVSNVFTGAVASGVLSDDSDDDDSDPLTDQVLSFGWASLFGQFPGSTNAELATVTFDVVDANAGSSAINFVSTSTAAGYAFDAPSYDLDFSQPDVLSIDAQSGEVTLETNPDYELIPQYSFDITATDASGNESEPMTVTLDIENVDDTAPQFESLPLWGVITESGSNQVVYTAQANDGDDPGAIVYAMDVDEVAYYSEGVIEQNFILEEDGSITMQLILRQDEIADIAVNGLENFDFVIGYNPDEVGSITADQLTKTVQPTLDLGNDGVVGELRVAALYLPAAADESWQQVLAELNYTHEPGVLTSKFDIYNVLADEFDYDDPSDVSSARLMLDTSLTIDSSTGEVTLASNPDATAQSEYSFTLSATDPMGNVVEQKVSLLVSDHIVTQDPANNYESGDLVYAAPSATNSVTYSLYGGENPTFVIDSQTGEVRFDSTTPYQAGSSYSFAVIATDTATNQSETTLVILPADESEPVDTPEAMITSPDMDIVLESGGSDQVVYTATSNIDGATYSLVDYTDYSVTSEVPDNDSDDDQPQIPAETVITVPEVQPDTQHVYISDAQLSEDGKQVTVTYSYLADNANLSGVGFTANFDSSVLTVNEISNLFFGAIASGTQSADDQYDDNDPNTDQALSFGWASLFGQFPGSTAVDLATVTFDIAEVAPGLTGLNIVKTSAAAGYTFDGQSQDLVISPNSASDNNADSGESQAPAESVIIVPEVQANTQHVYVSESTKSEDGKQVTITYSYLVDESAVNLSGVGFTVNFDSTVLSVNGISDVYVGAIASGTQSADDQYDDNDSATDQALSFGWASLFGQFPGSASVDLATVTFDIAEGATGSTGLNLVKTSNAAGFGFEGLSHNVVISAEAVEDNSDSSGPDTNTDSDTGSVITGPQLSIDSATGEVTLAGEADYHVIPNYYFTVTADNGTETASQDVGLLVADYLVSQAQSSYQGTADADVFALAGGSAQVTSGDGADIFILAPDQDESEELGMHTITDFESGVDAFDGSAALMAAGYTGLSMALDGGVQQDELNLMFEATADVLALVDSNSGSLDNVFGSYFDNASKELTFFADTDSAAGQYELETFKVKVEGDAPEEDDFMPTLNAFIA